MSSVHQLSDDVLLLERLDVLIETTQEMIKTFATREQRPLEQIRRYVAERHCSYLFASADLNDKRDLVHNVLKSTSQTLEALLSTASIHSFFLTVDPNDTTDEGFLGGTVTGREFWRGLRGGGSVGAKAFKAHCLRSISASPFSTTSAASSLPASKRLPANALKSGVYTNIRNSLRAASGIRNAEMKWKNQDQLNVYGVRLIGWPPDVPRTNPSTLSVDQNKLVLEALENNTLRFVPITPVEAAQCSSANRVIDEMDMYLRYEDPSATSASPQVYQCAEASDAVPTRAPSLPATGPSPFSVMSGQLAYTRSQEEVPHKKRCREDAD